MTCVITMEHNKKNDFCLGLLFKESDMKYSERNKMHNNWYMQLSRTKEDTCKGARLMNIEKETIRIML